MAFSLFGKSQDLRKLAAKAESAAAAGRAAEAEHFLREIVRLEPDLEKGDNRRVFAQAFLDLGEICEARHAITEAFDHYRRARQLGAPLTTAAWAALARGYAAAQSKTDIAVGAYLAYIHSHPPDPANASIYSTLEAACQVDEGRKCAERKQAFELNRRVAAASPDLDWPYYYMAVVLLMDGDLSSALANLLQAQRINPNRAMTYYWIGACHLQQSGEGPHGAIEALSKFLTFPADNPQMSKRQRKAAFELGSAYFKAGMIEESRQTLERAVTQYPDFSEARDLLAQVELRRASTPLVAAEVKRGNEALRTGDIAVAGQSYDQALEKEPNDPEALFGMGNLAYRMGEMEVAADYFSKILADHPSDSRAQLALGVVHCRTGRHRQAVGALEPLYRSGSGSDALLSHLGRSLVNLQRYGEAAEVWAKLLARHPEDKKLSANLFQIRGVLNYRRALDHLKLREFDDAINCLRSLPADTRVLYHLGLCHLLKGEPDEAIPLFDRAAAGHSDIYARYAAWAIANHYVGVERYDEAAAVLEKMGQLAAPPPEYAGLRVLTFHVALRQADSKALQHDLNGAASALAVALQTGPPDAAGALELERFAFLLPVSQVQAGARQDAAEAWERELKTHPGNRGALHNLAILYYWWAQHNEAAGGPDLDRLWAAAIAYWTLIVNSDSFWSAWKTDLEQRWGIELKDDDLRQLRCTFFEERFTRVFQNHASAYKEKNLPLDARRHEDYLTMALLEKTSAEAWRATGARFPMGGFFYCRQTGVLPEILEEIDRLPDSQQQNLKIYFSPARLGEILILIDEARLPEKALERLAALPPNVRQMPDAKYLLVRALFQSAQNLHNLGDTSGALERVERAYTEAQSLHPPWAQLRSNIGDLLDALARQEATRLRQENRVGAAIELMERLYILSQHAEIREYLCILCCDRGFQKLNEKEFENGRAYFQKALSFDADYQRARQAMCIAFNNEALDKPDPEARLKMLQKALEYNPHDQPVRENLAAVYREKAITIARSGVGQNAALKLGRAVGLLRTAALTLNPAVSEKWLTEFIAAGGERFQDEIRDMPAGPYRTVLETLSQVARQRLQLRSR